jgi:Zinc dependent phospholipase C
LRSPNLSGLLIPIVLLLLVPGTTAGFSVLGHQAVVDQAWDNTLLPVLRRRFPNTTEQELADARAYARGGSHLADLGYFPLGNRLFTDLLHYVRTGDFISRALAEANSPQEYAFALGALAHYEVDSIGHPQATNRVVPIVYPKLKRKYGDEVTYADKPPAHLQTEFRFDVLQVVRRGEIPGLFEHSVDFKVPREFLDRVFAENYGLKLDDIFENFDVALASYRWAFRTLIHEATGITWQLYREDIETFEPGMTRDRFLQAMSRADFVRRFGSIFNEPGYFVRFIGFLGNLLPNIGPFTRLPLQAASCRGEKTIYRCIL